MMEIGVDLGVFRVDKNKITYPILKSDGTMKTSKLSLFFGIGFFLLSCNENDEQETPSIDFREEMRAFVQGISSYSKNLKPGFSIIPQNGQELLTLNSDAQGSLALSYIQAIDGVGREDLFYGYTSDDIATPKEEKDFLIGLCDVAKGNGKVVLTTDYCFTPLKMDDSYLQNKNKGYVSFAADHRELDNVPAYPTKIEQENANNITALSDVKNFLYLINPSAFTTKQAYLDAIKATNYDLVLIDLFFDGQILKEEDINSLKIKANKSSRMVICYMSIGEAEDYRYYWNGLDKNLIYKENPDWRGNFTVKYWESQWKAVIYGNDQSYLKKIINAGFDGVYLDIIEAYEVFE
ncbi:MAG: hypothetical protein C0490_03540 [Marivirga sp.]|nr:hypothetical protein [Marivirga sp.]